jgi:hypothetical protein
MTSKRTDDPPGQRRRRAARRARRAAERRAIPRRRQRPPETNFQRRDPLWRKWGEAAVDALFEAVLWVLEGLIYAFGEYLLELFWLGLITVVAFAVAWVRSFT